MNLTNFIVIDTESTGLNTWLDHEAFCVGAYDGKDYYYWEWLVDLDTRKVKYKYDDDFFELQKLLYESPHLKFGFWNAKHDLRMLEKIFVGRKIENEYHEVSYMCKACNTMEDSYALKKISAKYLSIPDTDEKDLQKQVSKYKALYKKRYDKKLEEGIKQFYWLPAAMGSTVNLNKRYNLLDCKRTWEALEFFSQGMQDLNVEHTYRKEMRLLPIVYEMENRGVRIDYKTLKTEQAQIRVLEAQAEKETRELFNVGPDFNFDSPKQLIELLFNREKLPVQKETKKGNISTDVTTLKKLRDKHPGVDKLLQKRGYGKGLDYLNTYEKFGVIEHIVNSQNGDWVDKSDYRTIHANFNPWGTTTGRFSCNDPNLLNVTSEETSSGENVVDARHLFIPRQGYYWLIIDYAQQELRIFASRAQEEGMLNAFKAGRDIHDEVRRSVKRLAALPEKRGRKIAKNINFTKINSGGAKVLYEKYEIPLNDGRIFLKDYDNTYPIAKQHAEDMTRLGHSQGYIYNAYNRKLMLEKGFEYRASSYDIQSSACDVMKNAMIDCNNYIKEKDIDCHIVLQIYDELIFEVNKKCITKSLVRALRDMMENHRGVFSIPLPVDISITETNWRKKQKVTL